MPLSLGDGVPGQFGPPVEHLVADLGRLGGVATRAQLVGVHSRGALRRAVASGVVVRTAHGRYALAVVDEAPRVAHALSGALCLTSAALHHGWAVKSAPDRPDVWVPRQRRVSPAQRRVAVIHHQRLHPDDLVEGVTTKETTLLHCLRQLPDDEALAIADSALRSGEFSALRRAALTARGAGASRVRRIAEAASPQAANPFESVLRSIALGVAGLTVVPQHLITSVEPWARVDLADIDRRIAIEADSFEWHGQRDQLRSDCRRYDALVADGWIVLRFAWEDVMFDQKWVDSMLVSAVALSDGRAEVRRPPRPVTWGSARQ